MELFINHPSFPRTANLYSIRLFFVLESGRVKHLRLYSFERVFRDEDLSDQLLGVSGGVDAIVLEEERSTKGTQRFGLRE